MNITIPDHALDGLLQIIEQSMTLLDDNNVIPHDIFLQQRSAITLTLHMLEELNNVEPGTYVDKFITI